MRSKPGRVIQDQLRERLIVTLISGESFEGVLYAADEKSWELFSAVAIGVGDRGADVPVDGAVIVPVVNVAYANRP